MLLATSGQATNVFIARHLRKVGYEGEIVAAAQYDDQLAELQDAGVNSVHNVFEDAGWGLADHIFDRFRMTRSLVPLPPTRSRAKATAEATPTAAPIPALDHE